MKTISKLKGKQKYAVLGALLIFAAGWIISGHMIDSKAVAGQGMYVEINGVGGNDTYELRYSGALVYVKDEDGNTYKITNVQAMPSNAVRADRVTDTSWSLETRTSITQCTISVDYERADGSTGNLSRLISVPYAINEDPKYFNQLNTTDTTNCMIIDYSETQTASHNISMLFEVNSLIWSSSDPTVVEITSNGDGKKTGTFRVVGTGHAKLSVQYNDSGTSGTQSVDVYVGPNISKDGSLSPSTGVELFLHKPEQLQTGASGNNTLITDKLGWDMEKYNGNAYAAYNDEIFSHAASGTTLTTAGRAGKYRTTFYTQGIDTNSLSVVAKNKLVREVVINIYAELSDGKTYLQVGDEYDVAKVLNISDEDFNKFFTMASTDPTVCLNKNSSVVTAMGEGSCILEITMKAGVGENDIKNVIPVDGSISAGYNITVAVVNGFQLSTSLTTLYVGENLTLQALYGLDMGSVTWTTSDAGIVSISPANNYCTITGVRKGEATVKATMAMPDGRTFTATCTVKVEETPSKIILTPSSAEIKVDQSVTVKASFDPSTITTADLSWKAKDEDIVDISVGVDKKTAVITGKKTGQTIITVVNKKNTVMGYCSITVIEPITSLSITPQTLTVYKTQEVVKLTAVYTPFGLDYDALQWSSTDTSVAKVNEYGLVTLESAGTTEIWVKPTRDLNNVGGVSCKLTVIDAASSFSLNKASMTLEVGASETLTSIIQPTSAKVEITWGSTDTSVATVSNGRVTGVGAGVTYITANIKEGFIATCKVTVTQKATGISLSTYNLNLAAGESYTVTATPNPTTSTEKSFTWTSKDPSIATVTNAGVVTGVSAGSTIILVKDKSGNVVYLYVTVYNEAKGMTLNYSNKTVAKGSTFKLKAIFTPSNVSDKSVTWASTDSSVARVSAGGTVRGLKSGSCIITAVSKDGGYTATCLVTVTSKVTRVKLNHSSYKLGIGKTVTLKATVTSNTSSNKKVKWTSSNTSVAYVNSSGKVRGKKLGTCTITAKATDGSGKSAKCTIRVVRDVTSISLSKTYMTIVEGQTKKLTANIKPSNATYKTVKWTSSDTKTAIVDSKGNITGLAEGDCTITAEAKDNSKKKASCYLRVIEAIPASNVLLSAKNMVLVRGQSEVISYTVVPSNTTDSIKFSSDNKAIATVNSAGKVYARRTGVATITLTTSSGKQSTVTVTVIGLNKTRITLEQYDTETLFVDGATSGVTWYSENPSIATVVNGKVVARKAGSTYIYAKVSGVTLRCQVVVRNIS